MTSARGFTLIELLLTLAILAMAVGLASLALDTSGSRELRAEAEQLTELLNAAREDAEARGRELGWTLEPRGYRFLVLNRDERKWEVLSEERLFRWRELSEQAAPTLEILDGPLRGAPVGGASEGDQLPGVESELSPEVLLLSSGEATPFRLRMGTDESGYVEVASDGFAPVRWRTLEAP